MAETRAVEYRVGDSVILDGISIRFRPRRLNVILGPNGAGKSSLLKIAAGLLQPSAGEVLYEDCPIGQFSTAALARKRAVLSQHVTLTFPMPVQDVVMMGRYPHYGRAASTRDRAIVERALALVSMTAKRDQPYSTLSGGEQQKVQLARVLAQIWNYDDASEHKFLFLDEPTEGLDIHYQIHMLEVARELLDHNCTVVAIFHDLNLAFQYGDSFFVLENGRLVQEADHAADIKQELVERVFGVQAHRIVDPLNQQMLWRFSL
ncbi:MAG TPA: ATP-binding cassette domain-containing protein [Gammaproteobacteria bacterium]|nr:ATP-binding cassette domain-containing protein [Gammaproteobacteria bacterium]